MQTDRYRTGLLTVPTKLPSLEMHLLTTTVGILISTWLIHLSYNLSKLSYSKVSFWEILLWRSLDVYAKIKFSLVMSHTVASFWRLPTIPKALFLLLSRSYRISSRESMLSGSCWKKTTVQMVEMSLVLQEGNGFNCSERDSNEYLFGFKQVKSIQLNTSFLCKKELSQVQGCSYSGLFSLNTVQRCVRFRVRMSGKYYTPEPSYMLHK